MQGRYIPVIDPYVFAIYIRLLSKINASDVIALAAWLSVEAISLVEDVVLITI